MDQEIPKEDEDNARASLGKGAKQAVSSFTQNTSRFMGSMMNSTPMNALQQLTTRKYTLPDKTVASQVLMYRQLLHTRAKPGLKLSRPYQGTPAQDAVKHMPWWEEGIEETGRMSISYDNLIVRLWLNGAILPYTDLLDSHETLIDDKGLPPIPHHYWVDRLGFQQPDPVTDFRSGGVLSLGMMVYMVESCPSIVKRFQRDGDSAVLPFGLTCINVTDMMAKFLMLAKSVDRMDALLSQKPFWRMFADPNAILALQELSMTILCDVVCELERERKLPDSNNLSKSEHLHGGKHDGNVTVFDFPVILETTERRVGDDLLGAGPKTVEELREIAAKLRVKYQSQMEEKELRALQQAAQQQSKATSANPTSSSSMRPTQVLESAGTVAQDVFSKFKTPQFLRKSDVGEKKSEETKKTDTSTEQVEFETNTGATPTPPGATPTPPVVRDSSPAADAGWANVMSDETTGVTTAVGEFCIDDDDDEDDM